jgi:DNA polymerase III subunit epsilon
MSTLEQAASKKWREHTFIAFDTETTGKYPLSAEICELAAVKWRDGEVIDTFQTLAKPSQPMGDEVIAIHGITNEMVENAPRLSEKIGEFHSFIEGSILMAHHAPFDLGFVAVEFEAAGLSLPNLPVLCTSLMSRKLFPQSENHRLQTLIGFFELERGAAHRALDDAKACLEVGLRCMQKFDDGPLSGPIQSQGGMITWSRFSMDALGASAVGKALIQAVHGQKIVEMVYASGSNPGKPRRVHPLGLVRSLDGDFVVAYAEDDQRSKRYFLDKVESVKIV